MRQAQAAAESLVRACNESKSRALLRQLADLTRKVQHAFAGAASYPELVVQLSVNGRGELTSAAEPEFEAVVNAMLRAAPPSTRMAASVARSDLISDDEFDALLNTLRCPISVSIGGAEISTDDEFESLLDNLRGAR